MVLYTPTKQASGCPTSLHTSAAPYMDSQNARRLERNRYSSETDTKVNIEESVSKVMAPKLLRSRASSAETRSKAVHIACSKSKNYSMHGDNAPRIRPKSSTHVAFSENERADTDQKPCKKLQMHRVWVSTGQHPNSIAASFSAIITKMCTNLY